MARAALNARDYDQAAAHAQETKSLALAELKRRPLDAEPHLPTALGAAFEVQAQTLEARGKRTQAAAVLKAALLTYRGTSIAARFKRTSTCSPLKGGLRRRSEPTSSWARSRLRWRS